MKVRITGVSGGLYECYNENGEKFFCRARGAFRHEDIKVLVGDGAELSLNEKGENSIEKLYERKNSLIRPPLANLDFLYIISACANPEPSTLVLDKMTTIAEHNGITPVIVITKCDIDRNYAEELCKIYKSCGYSAFCVSSYTGEGTESLKAYIIEEGKDKISAFAGVSGAGKSTLLKKMFPDFGCVSGELSQKIQRGKNTTRKCELYPLENPQENKNTGFIADTPGFSMLDFERFNFYSLENLQFVFPEFDRYITKCRYTKCTHTKEEGCAILEAAEKGEIETSRLESYKTLFYELKDKQYKR